MIRQSARASTSRPHRCLGHHASTAHGIAAPNRSHTPTEIARLTGTAAKAG